MEMKELMAKGKALLKEKDASSRQYFEEAVEQGNDKANYYLATIYRFGIGVDADLKKAVELYTKAAKAGSNAAKYQLGKLSESGRGVKKSKEEAKKYYREAADANFPKAQLELAKILEKEFDKAKIREENNNKRAIKIINENKRPVKALKGDQEEVIVEYKIESDISNQECIDLYQKYVDATHDEEATLHLAYLYEIGKGIQKDDAKAVELYTSVAENGNTKIMNKLAKKFQLEGKIEDAYYWYNKLYQSGDPKASYTIALMYEEAGNQEEANKWYQVAADENNYDAKHKINDLKGKQNNFIIGQEDKKENNRRY